MVENLDIVKMLQNGAPTNVILMVIGYVINMIVKHVKGTNANTAAILTELCNMKNLLQIIVTAQATEKPKAKRMSARIKIPTSIDKSATALSDKT